MPYPGSRNLFNITRPFDILPLNETDTVGAGASAAAGGLPDEIGLYEGLIAPAGQNEYCLSGDIFDPYAEDDDEDDDDDDDDEEEGDASGMAARQLATTTLSGSSALGPIRSPASQSSGRSAVRSVSSGIATATATASGSAPSASTSGRVRGPLDGLITLKRCNASDPAQWWRFGADVRVTVPGVAPGQGWKLSLRNQTQCATILGVSPQDRSPSRVFKMYPCVSNGQSQLLYIVNNGTTASGARDDTASATNMTDPAGADADADAENAALGSIAAPGYGGVVGSLLISASVALWATAW